MKVLFLIQGFEVPSSRYRVLQYLPFLKTQGVKSTIEAFPSTFWERRRSYGKRLCSFDVVLIHRKRLSGLDLAAVKRNARAVVYDVDDAVMYRDTTSGGRPHSPSRARRFARMCQATDVVIVGNSYLEDRARAYAKKISRIPTCIDLSRYSPRDWPQENSPPTIGWIGTSGSMGYLQRMTPILEEMGQAVSGATLKIISDRSLMLKHMKVVPVPWTSETEVTALQSLDVGIMPLEDDLWSQGKCALKILQYQAAGVPVIASPVGMNKDVVTAGHNGFLASTPEEWVDALTNMAESVARRKAMGQAGFERVRTAYSLEVCAPRFYEVLKQAGSR